MGILSFMSRARTRDQRFSQLPLYDEASKERPSNGSYSSYDGDGGDEEDDHESVTDYSTTSSPDRPSLRYASSFHSSTATMLPRRPPATTTTRWPNRPPLYRLPNRVIRFLCIGMITTMIIFIFSLFRASQVENRKIANGEVKKPPPPPPSWESFEFLTRYYGGIRTLVPFAANKPQYPRVEDDEPYNTSQPLLRERSDDAGAIPMTTIRPVAHSKAFADYNNSILSSIKTADEIIPCLLGEGNRIQIPQIRYLEGRPEGFPNNVLGSYELLSLPEDICFDRYGKYAPYGLGYSIRKGGTGAGEHGEKEGVELMWKSTPQVDFRGVDWAESQRRCYRLNSERFKPLPSRTNHPHGFYIDQAPEKTQKLRARGEDLTTMPKTGELKPDQQQQATKAEEKTPAQESTKTEAVQEASMFGEEKLTQESTATKHESGESLPPRTAVVVRCWDEYQWKAEDIMNLRSLVAELSLASGGRYDVHLLVQVRNDAAHPIWADEEVYRQRIGDNIPEEFRGLVTLWTQTQMLSLYQGIHDLFTRGPDLPVHGVYRGLQMAMQYFAYNHPEYDYYWQWEMDIRYTGHYLDLFTKLENWTKAQPRKGLWERNARFYLPSVHGSWEDFSHMARVQREMGTLGPDNMWKGVGVAKDDPAHVVDKSDQIVWGPLRPADENDWFESESDPLPPTSYERDKYQWGVGEEADLIVLNPLFDPQGTTWLLADDITGYNEEGHGKPPRRAQVITASRMSRRLLMTMHRETAFKKHHAFPEMWPATVALQHGYKAVYAPHPVYVDREWPIEYMARVFNGGRNGATGGSRSSIFGEREHNFRGVTWYYNAGFSGNLYKRWLGLRVNNDGGEEFEMTRDESKDDVTVSRMRGGEGRMCLPPMLLHPVKNVDLPVETDFQEELVTESDPAA